MRTWNQSFGAKITLVCFDLLTKQGLVAEITCNGLERANFFVISQILSFNLLATLATLSWTTYRIFLANLSMWSRDVIKTPMNMTIRT